MTFGVLLLVPVFLLMAYTDAPPVVPMAIFGVSFALVPAVLWPALGAAQQERPLWEKCRGKHFVPRGGFCVSAKVVSSPA